MITLNRPSPLSVSACDLEPIHIPGSIQPHGVLLLFDGPSESLVGWAGDLDRMLGVSPKLGMACTDLLGTTLRQILGPVQPLEGEEPFYGARVHLNDRTELSAVLHKTGAYTVVELEPAEEGTSAVAVLERLRAFSRLIADAPSLEISCQRAVEAIQEITGYDRAMVYRFLEDGSGSVIAEARLGNVSSYLDHRFPASDIPSQARELYCRNLLRVIPDVTYAPALIQPASQLFTIDMSHSTLRSVSPIHIQYLKNMGVGASISVSLIVEGKLWGLIVCHNTTARRVPIGAQLLCREVGAALSRFIQNASLAEQVRRNSFHSSTLEQILYQLRESADPERTLRSSIGGLMQLVDADGLALLARGRMIAGAGNLPPSETIHRIGSSIESELKSCPSFSTSRLQDETGDCEGASLASGVLAIRIEGVRPLVALWTRIEQPEELRWAGKPQLLEEQPEGAIKPLTPRKSFATWRQVVQGRSRPWRWEEEYVVEAFKARAEFILQKSQLEQLNKNLAEANARLSTLATTDALTGLPNRRLFDEKLRVEWERCLRSGKPLALVAIDVDHFKQFNDRFGHPTGDKCLKQVAQALQGACRPADVAARMGGEEFALLLSDIDPSGALAAAERVRRVVEGLGIAHPLNSAGVVTISLGLAEGTPQEWGDLALLSEAADQALYEAKRQGRNRCVFRLPKG